MPRSAGETFDDAGLTLKGVLTQLPPCTSDHDSWLFYGISCPPVAAVVAAGLGEAAAVIVRRVVVAGDRLQLAVLPAGQGSGAGGGRR